MHSKTTTRSTKHETLTRALLEMVAGLKPGDRFPSQSELMRRFQVSDRTVLRSLDDLRRAGWIVRRHGSGTFVADPRVRPEAAPELKPESKTIAALALTFGPFYQHCVDVLSVHAEAAGLSLICQHTTDESSVEDVLPLEALGPRGFILFNYHLLPIALRLMERGRRVILMGAPPANVYTEAPCVYGDQDLGGWIACRHLLTMGHTRIGFFCTNTRYPLESTLRWKGHQRALEEASRCGVEVQSTVHDAEDEMLWRSDSAAMSAYFRRPDAPTAIAAWNDFEAVRLIRLLHNAGLRVPEDISVIGFDRLPVSENSVPALTTVDQHVETQLRAVLDLLARPTAPPASQATVVVPTLVSRSSCTPPRQN